ncbi:MAG: ATP-binding protein [Leptolyngbyaceae cyanobacterium bins.59]|nr:ATP-binding protein [Leptolyngbyaceae cyanobacterium bins.59]
MYIVITLEICYLVLNRIAVEDLARVFDRFWRSERSREIRQDGSGIGLALVKRLVEAQSGRIEMKSELGQGSTFRFCLPLAEY